MKVNITETCHDHIENYLAGHSSMGADIWGAHKDTDGMYIFRLLAPNADEVYIKGDFTSWENTKMTKNTKYGYFFIKLDANPGDYYKYIVVHEGNWVEKTDPFARAMDKEGDFASIITDDSYDFSDEEFIKQRDKNFDKPLNIYEIHIGSWLRYNDNVNFLDIVDRLVSYVKEMNYTHVEIMPITEYPYYPSWGYQSSGFFATSSRFGSPVDLKKFVDILHQNGIGVILDMVAVHFASDYFGLDHFDGTGMYESIYPDLKYSEWGSNNFDYSKGHVRSFMKSAMTYWLENFHFDGIRIDAVSYMIHYNGNKNRGVHKDNIEFIKDLNKTIHEAFPNVMLIAEDSSDFPQVTGKVEDGGLGFDYKWDLGWMNDTLDYFKKTSDERRENLGKLTFSMMYAWNEHYILPFSHDENVHGKATIVQKMYGEYEGKFPQARALYLYMAIHPGKMLDFMGNEFAQLREFDESREQDWMVLKYPNHDDFHRYRRALNEAYLANEAFWSREYDPEAFRWLDCAHPELDACAIWRDGHDGAVLAAFNFGDTELADYTLTLPRAGKLTKLLDTDWQCFGGRTEKPKRLVGKACGGELKLTLAPFSGQLFKLV